MTMPTTTDELNKDGNSPVEQNASLLYVFCIASVAAIGGFLFGFDSGVINGTVTALANAFNANDISTGFNVASVLLGCAFGALAAGPLADHFGRKKLMIVTAIIFAISAFGSGVADTSSTFILYRLLPVNSIFSFISRKICYL